MGSRNSENSSSMDFDEMSNLIGHNYAILQPMLALPAPNHDFLFEEVAHPLPLSPYTLRRVQEDTNLILAGGSTRHEPGPSQGATSTKSSKQSQTRSMDSVTKRGNITSTVLEDLQDSFQVNNGVLTVFVPKEYENVVDNTNAGLEHTNTTEPVIQNVAHTQTPVGGTWSSIVAKHIPSTETGCSDNAQIIFNEDGSATLKPPKDFLVNARKMWNTSLIGHFIRGSFDFKFFRDHAFKLWKNKGLSIVFNSSKGYFTFKFTTVQEKNNILALNSIQVGGKTMYLAPWMEANKFKKNVIGISSLLGENGGCSTLLLVS